MIGKSMALRPLCAAALVLLSFSARAQQRIDLKQRSNVVNGSILNQQQMQSLTDGMSQWVASSARQLGISHSEYLELAEKDRKVGEHLASATNFELRRLGSPEIDLSSYDFKMKLSRLIGFSDGSIIGLSFHDGRRNFCFPCEVGHNTFQWGVKNDSKVSRPSRIVPVQPAAIR